ncbi:acyltransferase [Vibrio alginolyticus]|uniref:acyltransferase n=1 Tax=Vibrio alginolyticus TaxID=663 RepID=UPI0037542886
MKKPLSTQLRNKVRNIAVNMRIDFLRKVYGISIGENTKISMKAVIDKTNPRGVNIGSYSYLSYGAMVLSHDFINKRHIKTTIGDNVFVGAYAVILPGISVDDNSIIAAGSVVTKDVPKNTLVAGNPARVIKENIKTGKYGKIVE